MKFNKESITTVVKAVTNTLVCSIFLIVGTLAALSLRGDVKFTPQFDTIIGSIILVYVLTMMFTLVYKSNRKG